MSRTYRRRSARHEYAWVLRELVRMPRCRFEWHPIDRNSRHGRRLLARFHSDAQRMHNGPPREFRKASDHAIRTRNDAELRRALRDPGYDPVCQSNHRHAARWDWA